MRSRHTAPPRPAAPPAREQRRSIARLDVPDELNRHLLHISPPRRDRQVRADGRKRAAEAYIACFLSKCSAVRVFRPPLGEIVRYVAKMIGTPPKIIAHTVFG